MIMKRFLFPLAAVAGLQLAGCGENEQAFVDNLVRQTISNQGTPQEVSMRSSGDHNFSGTASIRLRDGQTGRFNCTVARQGSTSRYEARCVPVVDQATVDAMKAEIRRGLSANGAEVVNVEMTLQDQNRMTGYADVRAGGEQVRATCEAHREGPDTTSFRWQCRPPEGQAASGEQAAPAEGGEAPTEGGQ